MSHNALVERIRSLRESTQRARVIVGLSGSPGAGKTTLALAIENELNQVQPGISVAIPMDGYHLANATLQRLGIQDRKGAIDTFDGWGFLALLKRIRIETEHTVYAPSFLRTIEEGVTGAIAVEPNHQIVLVEGNYILNDESPWSLLREELDDAWFCVTNEEVRLKRLLERHVLFGRERMDALDWIAKVDVPNATNIAQTARNANILVSGETGEILELVR